MKIAYLTNLPSPYRVEFFNELVRKEGIQLTVFFEQRTTNDRDEKWKSEEPIKYREFFLREKSAKGMGMLYFDIIQQIDFSNYDLFVIHGYSSPIAMVVIEYMKLKNIPFVISADGGLINQESKAKYVLKKHLISSATAWLSTGKVTSDYFVHYGAKLSRIYEYPFSSMKDGDIEKPATENEKRLCREKLSISYDKVVLYVGQLIYRKGIDILLESISRIKDADTGIYLVGGEPSNDLLEIVKDYGLDNVHFIPFKVKDELKYYYRAADVFVLPTREDIWGLVINEAMGAGLPVVSTNRCVAALTMIGTEDSGFIVPVDNSEELYKRIIELLNEPEKRKLFADNAHYTAMRYTIEKMAERHIEIFRELIK